MIRERKTIGMKIFTLYIPTALLLLCICAFAASCKKGGNDLPREEIILLEKVYKDGQLYLDIFYDDQRRINRIDYYRDNGELKSRRKIQLDERGRVQQVTGDFGNYVSTRKLTYEGDRKILDEKTYLFANGSPTTYGKRAWRYPKANVIEDLLYAEDLETVSYIHTFTFSESGNVQKKERNVLSHPAQNNYNEYQYDEGISYESMIESNIPGYSEIPVARNQLLQQKIFTPDGALITEVKFQNTYNEKGYLAAYISESAAGKEAYKFEYKTVTE
ncbi:MAG: hypothetical protein EAS52_09050 [Parapedobacter sp.]|nr:MAG: hypothetical protein EAS52_09050 [Parapedobacter sp.]